MANLPFFLAIATAISMAFGQVLFKSGSATLGGNTPIELVVSFASNLRLMVAIILYAVTILVWIYVLKHLPLSKAYPLTALSYVIVPIVSYFLLREQVGINTLIGSAIIILGVAVTHFKSN
jgi:drug/metabolite transporter (DMT)-like permease